MFSQGQSTIGELRWEEESDIKQEEIAQRIREDPVCCLAKVYTKDTNCEGYKGEYSKTLIHVRWLRTEDLAIYHQRMPFDKGLLGDLSIQ